MVVSVRMTVARGLPLSPALSQREREKPERSLQQPARLGGHRCHPQVTAGARIDATNAARQTPLRVAEGHLICCTTFARHEEAARVLRELGADPNVGVQLTFGLTGFGDETSPSR